MTHPATTQRGSSFVSGAGTSLERVTTQTSVPLQRRRVSEATPEALKRIVNQLGVDIHEATIGSRSIPFGGPVVVLEAIPFVNGVAKALAHRLKTSRIMWHLADVAKLTAGSPEAWRSAVDATTLTLTPRGTFTADVILMVKP